MTPQPSPSSTRRPFPKAVVLASVVVAALVAGCSSEPIDVVKPSAAGFDASDHAGMPADSRVLVTDGYDVFTTIRDAQVLRAIDETLDATRPLYEAIAPTNDAGRRTAYVFALREQWARHVRETTAEHRAPLFLNIDRGGYAEGEVFSTFFSGSLPEMLATIRHEGFHQHLAIGFERRPPPFLEEGLATLFEEGFESGDPTRPRESFRRLSRLREAVRRQRLWPLERLLGMHAGHVVGANDFRQINTFYSQAWAFASFLVSHPEYGPKLRVLLAGYADGTAPRNPPLAMQRAFGVPLSRLSADYQRYVFEIAGR